MLCTRDTLMERRCKALRRRENLLMSKSTKTLTQIGLLLGSIIAAMSASEDHWVEAWAAPPGDSTGNRSRCDVRRQVRCDYP